MKKPFMLTVFVACFIIIFFAGFFARPYLNMGFSGQVKYSDLKGTIVFGSCPSENVFFECITKDADLWICKSFWPNINNNDCYSFAYELTIEDFIKCTQKDYYEQVGTSRNILKAASAACDIED